LQNQSIYYMFYSKHLSTACGLL